MRIRRTILAPAVLPLSWSLAPAVPTGWAGYRGRRNGAACGSRRVGDADSHRDARLTRRVRRLGSLRQEDAHGQRQ